MYKIIGSDGKEYGPITFEQLKQWLAEGRVNGQTKALPEGAAEWKTLAELPEFAGTAFTPPITAVPAFQPSPAMGDPVAAPAIGLMIAAGLSSLGSVFNILTGVFHNWFSAHNPAAQPGLDPEMQKTIQMLQGPSAVIGGALGLIVAMLIIFGAVKMKKYQSYGWAMTACILAMLPCNCPCCFVGLGVGIWGLVILLRPEVKAAFH